MNESKVYYFLYMFEKVDNMIGYGSCKAYFDHDIPSMKELSDLCEQIKTEHYYRDVLPLNWLEVLEDDEKENI